jgi:hypothetical protein
MSIIVSGESLQEIANIYLGYPDDFQYNPYIDNQKYKHKNIREINSAYDNPKIVFCYSNRIDILSTKIHYFQNKFILITHNSDENIAFENTEKQLIIEKIYMCPNLIKWFTQNLCIEHSKLQILPIGIANQQWDHGSSFKYFYEHLYLPNKGAYQSHKQKKSVYFFFEISTNTSKRQICYNEIVNKIQFLNKIQPMDNFKRLSNYEFCICPEGNGIDTHRFWEALYLKCVPVVIRNPLIDIIQKTTNLPMIVIKDWNEFDHNNLPDYTTFDFTSADNYINLNFYKDIIFNGI